MHQIIAYILFSLAFLSLTWVIYNMVKYHRMVKKRPYSSKEEKDNSSREVAKEEYADSVEGLLRQLISEFRDFRSEFRSAFSILLTTLLGATFFITTIILAALFSLL